MKKGIACAIILVTFLVFTAVGCEEKDTPKMTAPEVCQYVNQALPDKYVQHSYGRRYYCCYTASSATYEKEGIWLVSVEMTVEHQFLKEWMWVPNTRLRGGTYTEQYLFNEATAALKANQ